MKFVGVRQPDGVKIARQVDDKVAIVAPVSDFYADLERWTAEAAAVQADLPISSVELAPAVWPGARVLCVGLNYRAHAVEGGNPIPDYPAIFGRWTRSLVTDGDTVPALDEKLDWEGELGVVIGREVADVDEAAGLEAVFGYAPFNDISARTYQRHTPQWTPGKNMDRSGAIGAVVTADEVGDPIDGLALQTRLNGELMQNGNTDDMIFPVGKVISYLSQIMTLYPGDVIATGTPSGVGYARNPPVLMKPGDEVEVSIERIGSVRSSIVDRSQRNG
jgi:2,4-didehydro-3-deoxy-L-rhamnonate hydrolase